MTFLTPQIAALAAAIAVPSLVILYFLKLRRRDMEISTTLLWKKAIQDMQANAPFQRLRRNILLLLQLLVLGAALFALAQPQTKAEASTGQRRIILIDRSASMQAEDVDDGKGGKKSRLAAAKEEAKAFLETMREPSVFDKSKADEAMVIVFDTTAEVRQQFTTDKRLLREAIDSIEASDGPTAVGEAMRLAKAQAPMRKAVREADGTLRMIEGLQGGEAVAMHLWSDGRLPDAAESMPGLEDKFTFHRVGSDSAPNVAIVGLRADRAFDNPTRLAIYVALQSTAKDRRSVDVELEIDGQVRGIQGITFEPARVPEGTTSPEAGGPQPRVTPQTGGVVFPLERGEGGVATLRIRPTGNAAQVADVLVVDDSASLIVPPAKKLAVGVVTKGNLFLSTALEGLPLAKLETMTPDEFASRARQERLGEFDVMVLDGVLPPAGVTAALAVNPATGLPPGRWLVLNATPGPALVDKGKGETSTIVVDWTRDHPALRNITLDNLVIAQPRSVEIAAGTGGKALAMTGSGPAVVELASADSRALVVPFDVAESTWPFDISFVVFLAQGVNYLGNEVAAAGGDSRQIQPGGVLSDRLPAGVAEATLRTPEDRTVTLTAASDGRVVFAPIREQGVYAVSWSGPAGAGDETSGGKPVRKFAAALLDSAESDVAVDDQLVLANQVVKATAQTGSGLRKLWPYCLLAALLVMLLEWFIYNRKVHV